MKPSAGTVLTLVIILFCGTHTPGQKKVEPADRAVWNTRAQGIADTIARSTSKVTDLEKATAFAKLAEAWWEFERLQSRAWLEKAVDTLFFYSPEDLQRNPKEYISTLKAVAAVASGRDQKQLERLLSIAAAGKTETQKESKFDADALIELATTTLRSNPERAAEIGILACNQGQPAKFHALYWGLKKVNAGAAERFIRAAISSVAREMRWQGMLELRTAVFPELNLPNAPAVLISSNNIKIEALNLFADFATQRSTQLLNKTIADCRMEATVLAPLHPQVNLLLLQRAPAFQQLATLCRSQAATQPSPSSSDLEVPSNNTVEELLRLADENKGDIGKRVYYLHRAVSVANDQKKYESATSILESMTDEERKVDQAFWTVLRYTVASGWGHEQYMAGDPGRARRILENVSVDTRPFSKIGFVLKFKSYDVDSTAFCLPLIAEAEKELAKSGRPFPERAGFWGQAIKLYSSFGEYLDASDGFERLVKALNSEVPKGDDSRSTQPRPKLHDITSGITPKLFEMQYQSLISTAESINEPQFRIQVLIDLMKSALSRLEHIKENEIKVN